MLKRVIFLFYFLIFSSFGLSMAYDKELAKRFDQMFSMMTPEIIAKRPCQVTTTQLIEMIKKKEPFIILDVRTPQETAIVGVTWKDKLEIPMDKVFKPENLAKLPKDRKIVVVCHTGDRAAAVVVALRAIGFEQAFQFKGGIAEMAREVGRSLGLTVFE
ncbi:MAG: rhodanese-like domain-containing protein [Caldimicrobium sp.]|nr:rhodanese-like domain-containing protein [Caldimicrobium sp.]MCX7873640.1 rhodanese-like domain-containing protein [Caldimicrobium sp.]MDW8094331.1 rhodanese-like domain-containing protein [Caldimicrobium sp.]